MWQSGSFKTSFSQCHWESIKHILLLPPTPPKKNPTTKQNKNTLENPKQKWKNKPILNYFLNLSLSLCVSLLLSLTHFLSLWFSHFFLPISLTVRFFIFLTLWLCLYLSLFFSHSSLSVIFKNNIYSWPIYLFLVLWASVSMCMSVDQDLFICSLRTPARRCQWTPRPGTAPWPRPPRRSARSPGVQRATASPPTSSPPRRWMETATWQVSQYRVPNWVF